MKIADSAIQLYSKNTFIEQHQRRESLTVWLNGREPQVNEAGGGNGRVAEPNQENRRIHDKVSLSAGGAGAGRQVAPPEIEQSEEQELLKDLNLRILKALFEKLTGKKFQVIDPAKIDSSPDQATPPAADTEGSSAAPQPQSAGYGLIYDYHESHYEYEKTEFAAAGVITTADGQRIDFTANLSMSREFYSQQNINIRAGDALKDPLVINFSGTAAQLTQRDFSFDIDADGQRDQIAFVAPGSGFLALDKNSDGRINDGSELFGTVSGDGFGDLSRYDGDGNNWIDENDAVYENLRIWMKDAQGEDQLMALGKVGVGALYLGHIETPFSLKDNENQFLGQIRQTGLAVMESGRVVTMQQVDLVA